MFKKSEGADAGDYKQSNSDSAHLDPAPTKHSSGDKKGAPALLGASIRIKGELSGDEDLIIQGQVEGAIDLKQNNLTVGAQGSLKANSRARTITVEGKVEGDLFGDERIVVKSSGDVRGNIVAPRVSLEDGSKFKGSIDMEPKAGKNNGVTQDSRNAKPSDPTGNANARGKDGAQVSGVQAKTI